MKLKICAVCGKEIIPGEQFIPVTLKDNTIGHVHPPCKDKL